MTSIERWKGLGEKVEQKGRSREAVKQKALPRSSIGEGIKRRENEKEGGKGDREAGSRGRRVPSESLTRKGRYHTASTPDPTKRSRPKNTPDI